MSETFIDLRSDTITQPTDEMRQAIAHAHVGDDVMGEDPTVNQLELRTAEILGKEAALFVSSGTMANQIALRVQTQPGDEIFIEPDSHMCFYEVGAPAAISGVSCRFVNGSRGIFTADALKAVIRPSDVHFPDPKLVCLENTHNRGGGSIWPLDQIAEVAAVARDAGMKKQLDRRRPCSYQAVLRRSRVRYRPAHILRLFSRTGARSGITRWPTNASPVR